MKRLWSADEAERQSAKREILEVGHQAIPPLISLLEDSMKHTRVPHFPTGREKEGEEVWKHWDECFRTLPADYLGNLEITWRLKEDTLELLGSLHAVEAVPVLIQYMEDEETYNLMVKMTSVMEALVKIGPPAVPKLIESIEKAPEKTALIRFGSEIGEQERRSYILGETAKIQNSATMVLGEIGDVRALPVLEKLLDPTRDPFLLRLETLYIQDAIEQIKSKSNGSNSSSTAHKVK